MSVLITWEETQARSLWRCYWPCQWLENQAWEAARKTEFISRVHCGEQFSSLPLLVNLVCVEQCKYASLCYVQRGKTPKQLTPPSQPKVKPAYYSSGAVPRITKMYGTINEQGNFWHQSWVQHCLIYFYEK